MDNRKLPKGYKNTEVGVIPEDWEVKKLGDILTFGSGKDYKHLQNGEVPVYGTGGIMTYVDDFLYDGESVGIGRKGTIDKPVFLNGKFWTVDTLFYTHQFIDSSPKFIYYKFNLIKWKDFNEASGVPSLSKNTLEKIKISVPVLPEQTAIATALSDTDILINSLETLIAKKRNIKQGAMQQLLKPKEGWEVKKLGEIATFFSGGTPNTLIPSFYDGEICWITSGDLNKNVIYEVEGRISEDGLNNSSAKMIKENTLLIALYGATAGVTAISKIKAAINQAILAIILNANFSIDFLYYQLTHRKEWLISTYTQGGQPNLSGNIIKSIEMSFPVFKEQTRIATILSDMDNEIQALETKLEKYRKIKQGMMQNLLTGKIRLV